MSARRKRALGAVSAVAALSLIGGVAAQFTASTTSAPQSIGTGTLALSLDNVAPVVWTDDISNLAAGDSVERFVDVRNSGSLKIAGLSATQTNTLGTLLSAPSDILVKFESCTVAWNTVTGACSGQKATVMANSSVAGWATGSKALATFEDFGAGDVRRVKVTTTLAAGAINSVQGKSGTITYTLGGTQRAAGQTGNGSTLNESATALSQPSNVQVSAPDATSLKVSFTDTNSGNATYTVSWGQTGNSAVAPQQVTLPAGQTNYTITGLSEGKNYDVTVAAGKNGQSAASTPVTATPAVSRVSLTNAKWSTTQVASLPVDRGNNASVASDNKGSIYYLGGQLSGALSATVSKYTVSSNTWSSIAPMSTARRNAATAVDAEGKVYVIGGAGTSGDLSSVERFDPATGVWTTLAPMPSVRVNAAASIGSDGKVYVMGGFVDGSSQSGNAVRYDPATNSWSAIASMSQPRAQLASVADANGNIYAIGGHAGGTQYLSSVEKFSISTGRWTTIASLSRSRGYIGASITKEGVIYVSGGLYSISATQNGTIDSVEKYDTVAGGAWSAGPKMSSTRWMHAMAQDAQGRLYALSGGVETGARTDVDRLG